MWNPSEGLLRPLPALSHCRPPNSIAPLYLLPYPESLLSLPVPRVSSDTELMGAVRASEPFSGSKESTFLNLTGVSFRVCTLSVYEFVMFVFKQQLHLAEGLP